MTPGAEVIYLGLRRSVAEIVQAAADDDADVIGISVLSGAHIALAADLLHRAGRARLGLYAGRARRNDPAGRRRGLRRARGRGRLPGRDESADVVADALLSRRGAPSSGARAREHGVTTDSGVPVQAVYTSADIAGGPEGLQERLGLPGEAPFTRGPYPSMYRGQLWTMRQFAGFGSPEETNARYRFLLDRGQTALSVAFDLPTQLGYDSADPMARAEVGRVGVAIDTAEDMVDLFRGLPLDQVSVNFTINATAPIILATYLVAAERQGVGYEHLTGTLQNDILKEFLARKTYIFPPGPSMRLSCDVIEFASAHLPRFNPISITGYHAREAGCDAVQELALTMASAIAYSEELVARGSDFDGFAPRLSFHFATTLDLFEEVAKLRAARRMWYRIATERFGATDPRSGRLRFFSGNSGTTLTAQQPLNNVIRSTIQCLGAVLGGAQSIHVMGYDEAFEIPSEEAVTLSLRTQQIIALESGVTRTVDPLAGLVLRRTTHRRDRGACRRGAVGDRGRRGRGDRDRAGHPSAVDRGVRLSDRARDRDGRASEGRSERPRGRRRRGRRTGALRAGRRHRRTADRPDGRARLDPRRDCVRGGDRRRRRGGARGPQRHARAHRGGARRRDRRRDVRRLPRRVRRVPGAEPVVSRPLDGLRVLDLTRFVAGSQATALLAALGADVIKLEMPPEGDPYRVQGTERVGDGSVLFVSLNTGKRSVALDFRATAAAEPLDRLLASSDFLVENARPGSLARYGLDWDSVHARHPRIVYGSISGYGDVGPDASKGGFDLILQAESGVMSVTGSAGVRTGQGGRAGAGRRRGPQLRAGVAGGAHRTSPDRGGATGLVVPARVRDGEPRHGSGELLRVGTRAGTARDALADLRALRRLPHGRRMDRARGRRLGGPVGALLPGAGARRAGRTIRASPTTRRGWRIETL